MPAKLDYTADGTPFWQADPNDTVDNVLYQQPAAQVTVNPIATQQPLPIDLTASNPFTAGISAFKNLTTNSSGERIQTWPERLARSAISLPVDVMQGNVLSGPGLRREDFTDEPIPTTPTQDSTWLGNKLGIAPVAAQPLDPMIERAQDMAGLAGGSTLAVKPGTASVGSGLIRPIENEVMANTANAPVFYSAVENAVKNSKQNVATADQWLGYLKNQPGVKQEELDWTLGSLPQGKITKAELEQHIADHKVELKEVNKGSSNPKRLNELMTKEESGDLTFAEEDELRKLAKEKNKTKFSQYQLPGGEPGSYREMLLTLPDKQPKPMTFEQYSADHRNQDGTLSPSNEKILKENYEKYKKHLPPIGNSFKSSHWNEPNVLAHIRMNDRMIDGKKTLHIEEVQSDWHQKGRKEGYNFNPDTLRKSEKIMTVKDADDLFRSGLKQNGFDLDKIANEKLYVYDHDGVGGYSLKEPATNDTLKDWIESGKKGGAVPNAPFKKNWDELALKKIIRHAAENAYDAISWTPGEAQAARYDLSKQISKITYNSPGSKMANKYGTVLKAFDHNGHEVINKNLKPEELPDAIGKEAAEKLLKTEPSGDKHELAGLDLKVGGEGMKGFYDKILVDRANGLLRKYGVKIEDKKLENGNLVHSFKLTNDLKNNVLQKGFPLFSSGLMLSPIEFDPFRDKLIPVEGNPFEVKK